MVYDGTKSLKFQDSSIPDELNDIRKNMRFDIRNAQVESSILSGSSRQKGTFLVS